MTRGVAVTFIVARIYVHSEHTQVAMCTRHSYDERLMLLLLHEVQLPMYTLELCPGQPQTARLWCRGLVGARAEWTVLSLEV